MDLFKYMTSGKITKVTSYKFYSYKQFFMAFSVTPKILLIVIAYCKKYLVKSMQTFSLHTLTINVTHINNKCKKYISWYKYPGSFAIEALTVERSTFDPA